MHSFLMSSIDAYIHFSRKSGSPATTMQLHPIVASVFPYINLFSGAHIWHHGFVMTFDYKDQYVTCNPFNIFRQSKSDPWPLCSLYLRDMMPFRQIYLISLRCPQHCTYLQRNSFYHLTTILYTIRTVVWTALVAF